MKRYIKSNTITDKVASKLNKWIDSGMGDVDIDDAIFDMGGDESTIDELRDRGLIDKQGHYVYSSKKITASNFDSTDQEAIAFAEDHKDEVIDLMNDTLPLWENFQDACIDKMIEMLEENGMYVSNSVESYLVDMFDGYGQV